MCVCLCLEVDMLATTRLSLNQDPRKKFGICLGSLAQPWLLPSHTHTELWWEPYQRDKYLQGTVASSPKLICRVKEKREVEQEKKGNTLVFGTGNRGTERVWSMHCRINSCIPS